MLRLRPALTALVIASLTTACRIQDRSPAGSRQDAEEIRGVVASYYDGLTGRAWDGARTLFWDSATVQMRMPPVSAWQRFGDPDAWGAYLAARPGTDRAVRPLRIDARQEGDFAAAWVETRRGTPADHFLLRRIDGAWRISGLVTVMPPPARR